MAMFQEYKDAQATLARMATEQEEQRLSIREAHAKITGEIGERIAALKNELWKAEAEYNQAEKAQDAAYHEARAPHQDTVAQTRRLLTLMDIARRHPEPVTMGHLYTYSDSYPRERIDLLPFDVLCASESLQIGAWIIPNHKPKNCLTLAVVGWSRFAYESLGLRPFVYLDSCHEEPYATVGGALRSAPTEAELKAHYAKVKTTCLRDYLTEHHHIEALYVEAQALLQDPAWLRLYLEDQKDYYEHRYSGGTDQPEYKPIIAELASLEATGGGHGKYGVLPV